MNKLVKTIDILRIERTCAQRRTRSIEPCDKNCSECDLNLPRDDVINAYNTSIAFMDVERNKIELLKGEKL